MKDRELDQLLKTLADREVEAPMPVVRKARVKSEHSQMQKEKLHAYGPFIIALLISGIEMVLGCIAVFIWTGSIKLFSLLLMASTGMIQILVIAWLLSIIYQKEKRSES